MEVMGCQVHAIGKPIRPLFADLVTNETPLLPGPLVEELCQSKRMTNKHYRYGQWLA